MDSSRSLLILGLSLTGITLAVAYLLFRRDESEPDMGVRTSRRTVIKVNVPNEVMGTVIGRGGCNIQNIQQRTGAHINCGDQASKDDSRVVTIQGTPEAAQLAESMIHEIIMNQPLILTHEMWVPARACGRIIGKGGETIRSITRSSCAKIIVDSAGNDERAAERRVLLKGTAEQIAIAQCCIDEKVQEDAEQRRRVELTIANRSPRKEPKQNLNYLLAPSNDEDEEISPHRTERFDNVDNVGCDGFFDVFVSALENPGQFWVQLVNSRGAELDLLVDKMTDYYTKPENKKLHALQEISVGQIVAAPFNHDNKWYRAEILKIDEDEYDPAESRVTLYYADYGDSCFVRRNDILDLRTDFLTLYFQAIECTLAHVKPFDGVWSDEALNLFSELTEVAMWRKKLAHVVTYQDGAQKTGQRAGSPVPVIELHDLEKNVNIGEELVKKGFAVWKTPTWDRGEPNVTGANPPVNAAVELSNLVSSTEGSILVQRSQATVATPESSTSMNHTQGTLFKSAEKCQEGGKFRPKTLGPAKKPRQQLETIVVPERFSSDEDEGFTLE